MQLLLTCPIPPAAPSTTALTMLLIDGYGVGYVFVRVSMRGSSCDEVGGA